MLAKRIVVEGTPISPGIVLGHARVIVPGNIVVPEFAIPAAGVTAEIEGLHRAIDLTIRDLKKLRDSAGKKMGGPIAKIFEAQLLIASDKEFIKNVSEEIKATRRNAAYVYNSQITNTIAPLKTSTDGYMRQMASDIDAVAQKVLAQLTGRDKPDISFAPNTILVGKSFTPGEIMTYRQSKAIGFVVSEGGRNSHMALIARGLMLPVAVTPYAWTKIPDNCRLILDGSSGKAIIDPTDEDWADYQKLRKRQGPALIRRISKLPQIPPVTRDGREVGIGANLSLPGPADDIIAKHKIPVGLYRTEFLFLRESEFPDEETQYKYYEEVAEHFADSSVVLRTFDLGYDKLSANQAWLPEDNPALGWRGMRPMFDMPNVFKTQVRAMLRASVRGNLKIMLPMISDLNELERAKKTIAQVKFKLRKEKIAFDENIKIGIMIEVPSAAMSAKALARHVDFMSIGTNDLTQYTLAADRVNQRVAYLYSAFHPAVLNLIKMTVDACKEAAIPVSICGEVAGDLLGLPIFVGMGVDMLSMNPARIVDFCRAVNKIDSSLVRPLLQAVLSAESLSASMKILEKYRAALSKRKKTMDKGILL